MSWHGFLENSGKKATRVPMCKQCVFNDALKKLWERRFTVYHQKLIITHKHSEPLKRKGDTLKSIINPVNAKNHATISHKGRSERGRQSPLEPEHLLKTNIWSISTGGFISATMILNNYNYHRKYIHMQHLLFLIVNSVTITRAAFQGWMCTGACAHRTHKITADLVKKILRTTFQIILSVFIKSDGVKSDRIRAHIFVSF